MGFMDELRKLTQPYDEEDDFFDGADESLRQKNQPSQAQIEFEQTFGDEPGETPEPAQARPARAPRAAGEGGFLSAFMGRKSPRPKSPPRERVVEFGGKETQVRLFNPRSFEEAGELVDFLNQKLSVVLTLEGLDTALARRLLDFLSGIAFALQGKITPVSGKTYFVTPHNVDIVGADGSQPESDGQYF